MKGMESFVVHAANISIYVEIEFQPSVQHDKNTCNNT